MRCVMKINELETAVLLQQLSNIGVTPDNERIAKLVVTDRWFSGAGFITELANHAELKIGKCDESYSGGEVGAKLNSEIDSGYLFYIKNGYISSIEGYTFGDAWPDEISSVETYKSDLG